jgi:hypothetical protein
MTASGRIDGAVLPTLATDGWQKQTSAPAEPDIAAREAWRCCAAGIAGQERMRIADDRRRFRREVPLSADPPRRPAAVRIYADDGTARTLVVDLDVKRGGRRTVLADCERVVALATQVGIPAVVDESISGGRHVYLPLATPRTLVELRPVVRALAAVCRSMDVTPMLNLATGCIRPPGGAHRFGGAQRLLTSAKAAGAAFTRRADDDAWTRLVARLAPHVPADMGAAGFAAADELDVEEAEAGGRPAPRPLAAFYEAIATTGDYPRDRYPSASEARLGVLASAAAHGWTLSAVRAHLAGGSWPGLAGFFARYSASYRPKALRNDWQRAVEWTRSRSHAPSSEPPREPVPDSPTRELPTSRGVNGGNAQLRSPTEDAQGAGRRGSEDEYRWIRQWWSAVQLAEADRYPGTVGLTLRAVLASVGAAAQKRGSRYLALGTRALSFEAGCDPTTVAAALRTLRAEPDPFLVLLEDHRGPGGDLYELRIPDRYAAAAEHRPWPKGKIPGVDIAFRGRGGLGLPAYFAYRALSADRPQLTPDLQEAAGISRSAAYRALDALADVGLARRVTGGWIRGRISLLRVRTHLGADTLLLTLRDKYRVERRTWWAVLGYVPSSGEDPSPPLRESDTDHPHPDHAQTMTALELLEDLLGATLVPPEDLMAVPHPVLPYLVQVYGPGPGRF